METITLFGREVWRVPTSKGLACGDCGGESRYLMIEKEPDSQRYYRAWFFCGSCEIGG